ncbi:sulfatase-like hydrolase/transferase [Akkermansia sp. N21169]|jgi:arylsulfatase A-like enzyme|uniref:sulfatase-like hydrolase/transferase n=1 Tax=Akkermansia sp. N21169 TaxID=3040765 RepID=UPI00244EF420|nr:sulfatase-like hydrolase/transferase [Akkermansia sp. N21169]MDH3069912.1 sulfatase-like hydrolase/transferase [Akkermansia sp. N21169]
MRFFHYLLIVPVCLAGWSLPASAKAPKPNIVFILVDDMGWGDLGCFYQNDRHKERKPVLTTPNLDKMGKEGIQLRRHYSGAPVCAPSRASLFSGVHQGNARVVRDNTFDMPLENSHTLASVLKQAGYSTALIGKWGLGGGRESGGGPDESTAFPTKRGFDYFFGYLDHIAGHRHYPANDPAAGPRGITAIWDNDKIITKDCDKAYSTDLLTARAKKWIVDHEKEDPGKPFFLALTYIAPHAALKVPTKAYPSGGGLKGGVQWIGEPGRIINTASGEIDSFIYPRYKRQDWPEFAKRHATMIGRIDEGVGDILHLLKDLKIDKNTLVVFASDNGPHNEGSFYKFVQNPSFFRSYGPFDGIKRDMWEGGMRVPALVRWPAAIPAGQVSQNPGQFHDWMATFAEVAGVPVPARTDGTSLIPTLTGHGERQEPGIVYFEYNYGGKTPAYADFADEHKNAIRGQQQAVYIGKYIGVRTGIKNQSDDFQIFDTEKDPQETNNLATSLPNASKLQQEMKDKVLRVRRVYDYNNTVRGNLVHRPYDNELVPGVEAPDAKPGLAFALIDSKPAPWVPRAPKGTKTESVNGLVFPASLASDKKGFSGEWSGLIRIPKDGDYKFFVKTDANSGSKAFVRLHGKDGMALVDADFAYTPGEEVDSSAAMGTDECKPAKTGMTPVHLKAGLHPITIGYVHGAGESAPVLDFSWKGPQIKKALVPADAFFQVSAHQNR